LLDAMLVRSDNAAAETLAADYPGGRKAFIKAMNNTARELGMYRTKFVDPSGLGIGNVSTAMEVATLIQAAAGFDSVKESSTKPRTQIHRTSLKNTNTPILFKHNSIVTSSKTGFTRPAGFCVAMSLEKHDNKYVVVVLGSASPISRFNTADNLINTHVAKTPFKEYNLSKI
jgi:serine-type D-Ala-D-Ala endopeptidase (penicillin-binding protein 7)